MQPNLLQDGTTLLTYSLTTMPMPVQVSPSTTSPSPATLIFVVSCPRSVGIASVAQIKITLPSDTGSTADATNLCMIAPPQSSASISASSGEAWSISASGSTFTFTPTGGPVKMSTQSLTIEFRGIEVSTLVGTALVSIKEWAAQGDPPPITNPPSGTQNVAVAKFPYGFYAGNFICTTGPIVPNGGVPEFSWSGSSNAQYTMLYESNEIDVSDVRTWSPPNGLTQMTTFTLQVSAQEDEQTATIEFSLTIQVQNPSLMAQDLTVLQASTLKGAVNVGASEAPANLVVNGNVQAKQNLAVDGPLNANAAATVLGTLNVSGAAQISNTLNVTGGVSFGNSLNVTGGATFNGGVTANSGVTANNGLIVNNGLTVKGAVSIFKWLPDKLGNAWSIIYQAESDGLLIGTVYPTSTTVAYYNLTIYANTYTFQARATGGGTIQTNAGGSNYQLVQTSDMFTLPVLKGDVITMGLITPTNPRNLPMPSFAFYWYPYGTGSLIPVAAPDEQPEASKKLTVSKPMAKKKAAVKKKPAARKRRKS